MSWGKGGFHFGDSLQLWQKQMQAEIIPSHYLEKRSSFFNPVAEKSLRFLSDSLFCTRGEVCLKAMLAEMENSAGRVETVLNNLLIVVGDTKAAPVRGAAQKSET